MDGHNDEQEFDHQFRNQSMHFEDDRSQDESTYFASNHPGWMQHIQPVPVESFSRAVGPLVYEGYVPSSRSGSLYPAGYSQDSATSFYPQNITPSIQQTYLQGVVPAEAVIVPAPILNQDETPARIPTRKSQRATKGIRRGDTLPASATKPIPPRPERKRGRKKGEKRGPREVLDPGDEFNALHRQATEAFLDRQDHETALQNILQAISINPEIYSAHVLLSEIYFARGENDKAFAALFSGAHAAPNDPNVWHQLADACLQKSTGDRETALKQASYCFSRILNIDQKDSDARFQKAAISKELGYYAKALKDLDALLKDMPYNSSILRQIAEVCTDLGDVTKAKNLYEEALEAQRSNAVTDDEAFGWTDLIVYVDLVSLSDGVSEAIKVLKDISRSFVGREEEGFWNDIVEDDREWDESHEPRRTKVAGFRLDRYPVEWYGASLPLDMRVKLGDLRLTEGKRQEALHHFEWLEPEARGEESNVYEYPDLFLQTGDSLRIFRDFQQAYRYYNALKDLNAYDDAEFWLGIGACAYACGVKDDAITYYENAKAVDPQNAEAGTQLSKLYTEKGDRNKAIKHAREALTVYENSIGKSSKRKYERKETREAREEAQVAYKKAYMLTPPPGERRNQVPAPSFSRRAREKKRRVQRELVDTDIEHDARIAPLDRPERTLRQNRRRLTKAQRTQEQQEANIQEIYASLCNYAQAMRQGEEEARSIWLECAEALIDEFRSQKSFYPAERYRTFQGYENGFYSKKSRQDKGTNDEVNAAENQEDVPIPSIESAIPDSYCGIAFPAWLDVFLEYAILLANLQYEPSECYTIINAAQDCTIWYHDVNSMTQIYMCYVVCALALCDDTALFGTALRWIMREYAFCSDVYRLFSAINFYYPHVPDKGGKLGQMANAKFRIPPNQKFLFRHLVSLDSQLPEDYGLDTPYGSVPLFMRKERHEAALGYLKLQAGANGAVAEGQSQALSRLASTSTPLLQQSTQQGLLQTSLTKPVEMEVHLLIVYGQILYASGSFPNALSYFYRAMSLSPQNPVLLFTMSLCYLHQMLKRQCENRHMYFLQGMALFERYADARLSWAEEKMNLAEPDVDLNRLVDTVRREIEFNRARCWHMVGMADLAIRGYASMLDAAPVKREDEDEMAVDENQGEEYSMEAAYSMALMYATNGDTRTAKEITEKWLVIE